MGKNKTVDIVVGLKRHPATVQVKDLRGYQLLGIIGSGSSATVYECEDGEDGPRRAMKIQKYDEGAEEEARVAHTFSDLGVAPTYIDSWNTKHLSFLVTDKWDGSMRYFQLTTLPQPLVFKLEVCVKRVHEQGLVHGDLLPKNILVKMRNGVPVDVTLSDFGLVRPAEKWNEYDKPFLKSMVDYYRHPGNPTCEYMKRNHVTIEDLQRDPFQADLALLDHMKRRNNTASSTTEPEDTPKKPRRSKRLAGENVDCPQTAADEQGGCAKRAQLRVPKPKGW